MALQSPAADDLEALQAAVLPPDSEPPQVPPETVYLGVNNDEVLTIY